MKKAMYILFISLLGCFTCKAQNNAKSFEEIALERFFTADNLKGYEHVKYFIFDGELSNDFSNRYSFCVMVPIVKDFDEKTENEIKIPYREDVKSRLGIFRRIFVKNDKVRKIRVHRYYPYNNDYVVVVEVFNDINNDFFSFIIDSETKQIKESCNQLRYS